MLARACDDAPASARPPGTSAPRRGRGALGAQAVDNLLLTREAISCVAARAGLSASFLPKLGPHEAGSGAHCHISLFNVRARVPRLHDPLRRRLPGRALKAGRRASADRRPGEACQAHARAAQQRLLHPCRSVSAHKRG
jgi:hypothetical protein